MIIISNRRCRDMPRPFCCRSVSGKPTAAIFKPIGIPVRELEEVVMGLDEFEAMRLADLERLYQEQAAEQMKVSRPTFSRIIDSARHKIADAIVHGKALRIEGGTVQIEGHACCRLHNGVSNEPNVRSAARRRSDSTVSLPTTVSKEEKQ